MVAVPQLDNLSMVSMTVKVFWLFSGVMVISTPDDAHILLAAMVKLDGDPSINVPIRNEIAYLTYRCAHVPNVILYANIIRIMKKLTTITPLCYISIINILIPSAVTIKTAYI